MFADIGIGIVIAVLAAKIFGLEVTKWLVLGAVVLALLPDADFIVSLFKQTNLPGKWDYLHRDLFHVPLLYIPIGAIIAWQFGKEWVFIFIMASLWHFVHDTILLGWGVKWLYPFSNKNFIVYQGDMHKWFLWISPSELAELVKEYGKDNWIRHYYLSGHPLGVIEFLLFIGAIALLLLAK